jgi:hypothetical protein
MILTKVLSYRSSPRKGGAVTVTNLSLHASYIDLMYRLYLSTRGHLQQVEKYNGIDDGDSSIECSGTGAEAFAGTEALSSIMTRAKCGNRIRIIFST